MLRVGLTGGIASGKSTVAAMLRDRECLVLDADSLAHELLEPGQDAYNEVVRMFGDSIVGKGGAVDRTKLGAIVFGDSSKRKQLEKILHPRIQDITAKWFAALDRSGGADVAFDNAALIFEAGSKKNLDRVVVCWCRPEQQLKRLQERGLSLDEARRRVAAQMPIDEKRLLGDDVIDCSGGIEETERQVTLLVKQLKQVAAARKRDF